MLQLFIYSFISIYSYEHHEPSGTFFGSSLVETSRHHQTGSDLRAALKIFNSSLASRKKGLLAHLLAMLGSLPTLLQSRPYRVRMEKRINYRVVDQLTTLRKTSIPNIVLIKGE